MSGTEENENEMEHKKTDWEILRELQKDLDYRKLQLRNEELKFLETHPDLRNEALMREKDRHNLEFAKAEDFRKHTEQFAAHTVRMDAYFENAQNQSERFNSIMDRIATAMEKSNSKI
jgi:uncharacterized protein YdaT